MATEFWLPEQLQREQFVEQAIDRAKFWTKIVKAVDPELSIVFVRDTEHARSVNLAPGRWHVRRQNRGLPDSYMPVTTPDGGYREPDQGMLDELGRRDMWRTVGTTSQQIRDLQRKREREDRDKALKQEQLKDMAALDFRAARRVAGENIDRKAWGKGRKEK